MLQQFQCRRQINTLFCGVKGSYLVRENREFTLRKTIHNSSEEKKKAKPSFRLLSVLLIKTKHIQREEVFCIDQTLINKLAPSNTLKEKQKKMMRTRKSQKEKNILEMVWISLSIPSYLLPILSSHEGIAQDNRIK